MQITSVEFKSLSFRAQALLISNAVKLVDAKVCYL